MKVATINARSLKLLTLELIHTDTDLDDGERAHAATASTTGDTTITYPVYVQVFEAPAPQYLNDE